MQLRSEMGFRAFRRLGPGDFEPAGATPGTLEVPDEWLDDWLLQPETSLDEATVIELSRLGVRGLALRGADQLAWLERFPELRLLKALDRTESRLSDAGFALMAGLVELRSLIVYGYGQFGDAGLRELALCTELRELHLQTAGAVSGAGLSYLSDYLYLRAVTLGHARSLDDQGLHQAGLEVQWLRLDSCPGVDGSGLVAMPTLRTLSIDGGGLSDVGLVCFTSALSELQQLTLSWCDALTDDAMTRLARLPALQALEVTGCPLGHRALGALSNHPNLRRLRLDACDLVTDAGLKALEGVALERLELRSCPRITASGVRAVMEACQPDEVRIHRCPGVDMRQLGADRSQ